MSGAADSDDASDEAHAPGRFAHRRTQSEIRLVKKRDRTDLKPSEWNKFGYASRSDVLTRPIEYNSQTVPIPRVKRSDITYKQFFDEYASRGLPVIIEGAASHWPAMRLWSMDLLEERFRNIDFKVGQDDKGKTLRVKFKYFADYMKHQQDDNPLYLFETGINNNAHMHKLVQEFEVPDLFPHDWMNLLNQEARPPWRWFCIGPKRSGTTVHTDPLDTSAWNAVTHGCKRWALFEPGVPKKVVKGKGLKLKDEDDEAIMYFDFLLPRLKHAHPEVRVYEGMQYPGDVIFVPGKWWHAVLNTEDCVAVTQNYCGPDNFEEVWKRTRQDREKIAHLWLRNMRKFAPALYRRALDMNSRDNFRMRHERKPGERLSTANSSSSESSSDSSSDEIGDFDPRGLQDVLCTSHRLGENAHKRAAPEHSDQPERQRAKGIHKGGIEGGA